jgi:hypothetical protein
MTREHRLTRERYEQMEKGRKAARHRQGVASGDPRLPS